jgi:hypothetical protein
MEEKSVPKRQYTEEVKVEAALRAGRRLADHPNYSHVQHVGVLRLPGEGKSR